MKHRHIRAAVFLVCLGTQTAPAETSHVLDVLGVYSDHVAQRVADPEALFVSHIEYANRALQNSGANFRYNLVHVQQQNWSRDEGIGIDQLESLAGDTRIQQLREEYGADLVAGMAPSSGGYCGIAYLPPASRSTQRFYSVASRYAYSLSGDNCGGRTMAHEVGHNAGLGHSPAQGSEGSLATWGRGWGVNGSFVTIMAYNSAYGVYSSAGRLQIHSNPALSVCRGQKCGNPISVTDGADATRALNLAAPQMAYWRDTVAVAPENRPPVAENDSINTNAGEAVSVSVLQNDYDPDDDAIIVDSVAKPLYGDVEIELNRSKILYTPPQGFHGEDSFTYTIMDNRGATGAANVSVQVAPRGDGDSNLVINGDAESGLQGWAGVWSARLTSSEDAHSGDSSIRAYGGRGVLAELKTPIDANRGLAARGWLKASADNRAYVYLYVLQNGRWSYKYMTAVNLRAGVWTQFGATRVIGGSSIGGGAVLFYFPYGINGQIMIDDVQVQEE